MPTILALENVSKHYPTHRAVNGVSLSIPQGSFFSLLGPSGCGKTTTLRMIAGFEQPTTGSIHLNGIRIDGLRPYERNVSTVFQSYALFPHLTVRGNVEFGLRQKRMDQIARRTGEALELVRLSGKESRYPHELSGGERQRVALARSLVLAPDVLLLDEPLSALDPKLRKEVRSELKSLQRTVGITFLFITHDQEEALTMSDRIAVMNAGEVEQEGRPEEIYLRPRTRFVASFLGAMNWVKQTGIRPEAVRISRTPQNSSTRCHPATVTGTTFLGNCLHVETTLASGERVVAEVRRDEAAFAPGESVHVSWHAQDELSVAE